MPVLRPAALDRYEGLVDDETFLLRTRFRLGPGATQVDISTLHHLYADLLAEIWPTTQFIITMRDVRSWTTSVLGLLQRKNAFLQRTGASTTDIDARYHRHLTGVSGRRYADPDADLVAPLMRYWTEHHRRLALSMNPARVEYRFLIGQPGAQEHVTPVVQPDRFLIGDRAATQAVYESTCADLMVEYFPDEHARLYRDLDQLDEPEWNEHVRALDDWLTPYVVEGSLPPGASAQGWT
jgi:hypothetical protein